MAVGQVVLSGMANALAVRAAEDALELAGADAGRVHARLLRSVLAVHRGYGKAGMVLSAQSQVALLLRTSEWRAGRLLTDALALAELPEAFEALEWGLLTVEQSAVLAGHLAPLPAPDRLAVWQRLLDRLRADLAQGTVRPPARLAELLKSWVIEADPDGAADRREQAEQDRRVDYRRRQDGLGDLFLMGFRGPQLQTILSRIAERSAPFGADDLRTADQRRFDAVQDMLLGRDLRTPACPANELPVNPAAVTPAEQPVAPSTGVPGDPVAPEPAGRASRLFRRAGRWHPDGAPGSYKVAGRLRKLLFVRAPRCEFPGCGARAVRCDAEHDLAWPAGPTCACNLGPCCRRHHRVKQEGWTKTRGANSAVTWTSPSGRQWLSPSQHQPPAPPGRPLPPLPVRPNPLDELSPTELEHELWWLAGCPDDPDGLELRAVDTDPDDHDLTQDRILHGDTRWTLDLADPYAWLDMTSFSSADPQL